jgi:hypothetical protein
LQKEGPMIKLSSSNRESKSQFDLGVQMILDREVEQPHRREGEGVCARVVLEPKIILRKGRQSTLSRARA